MNLRRRIANALSVAVTAANGCDRTLALITGELTPLQNAIDELLAEDIEYDINTIEQGNDEGDQAERVAGTVGAGATRTGLIFETHTRRTSCGRSLRPVVGHEGRTFVVMLPRDSGKEPGAVHTFSPG